jgi:aminopeptidase N
MKRAENHWTAFGDNWPNRARHWLPTIDHPSDKATVTWIINAPSNRTVIANGGLAESAPPANSTSSYRRLTTWEMQRPIPTYVMVLAAAPLISRGLKVSKPGLSEFPGGIPQQVHAAPEDQEYIPGPFEKAVDIVEFFAGLIGPFPYEKLDHVQSSTLFGGMENASAIFYSDEGFKRRQISAALIAHETAHQWFGDAVTPLDWPHVWLSEGFATYWAELWMQYDKGEVAFRSSMASMRDQIIRSRVTLKRPVIDTAETNLMALLNSNSYQKGAWILHMLRSTIGDTAFFRGMGHYYRQFRHQSVLSSGFQRAMESSAGKELSWFFDQWLRRPGFIRASLRWDFRQDDRSILLRVKQDTAALPYRFVLKLKIDAQEGKSTTTMVDIPADPETTVRIPWTGSRPTGITFDPFTQLLWRLTEE